MAPDKKKETADKPSLHLLLHYSPCNYIKAAWLTMASFKIPSAAF